MWIYRSYLQSLYADTRLIPTCREVHLTDRLHALPQSAHTPNWWPSSPSGTTQPPPSPPTALTIFHQSRMAGVPYVRFASEERSGFEIPSVGRTSQIWYSMIQHHAIRGLVCWTASKRPASSGSVVNVCKRKRCTSTSKLCKHIMFMMAYWAVLEPYCIDHLLVWSQGCRVWEVQPVLSFGMWRRAVR